MTKKIVAYNSIGDQLTDELGWWCWDQCWTHGCRALKWFLIVSSPVFVAGAAVAPKGIDRLSYGVYCVGKQHEFLWTYAGKGIEGTFNAVGSVLYPILDNGASEAE